MILRPGSYPWDQYLKSEDLSHRRDDPDLVDADGEPTWPDYFEYLDVTVSRAPVFAPSSAPILASSSISEDTKLIADVSDIADDVAATRHLVATQGVTIRQQAEALAALR